VNDEAAPQATALVGLVDRLWRLLAWPRLTLILLVWAAVVLALSIVVPQAPPRVEDPIVRSQWLAEFPVGAWPAVERLQSLGIFNLRDSIWLRLPVSLLLAHALVMLAALGPTMWHRLRWSSHEFSTLGKPLQLEQDLPVPAELASQQLISRLEGAGYRTSSLQAPRTLDPNLKEFTAWRWRWSWLGLAALYLGLGLTSLGLILEGWLGQVQDVNLGPDNPVPLPATGAPNMVLEEVRTLADNPLRPTTGVVLMRLSTGGGESQYLAPKLHNSYLVRGVWLTVAALEPMAEASATNSQTGETVLLQPFSPRIPPQERVRIPATGDPETRFIGVPSKNVTLRVDYQPGERRLLGTRLLLAGDKPQSEDQRPSSMFSISFFRGAESTPSRSASVPSGGEVTFDGVNYLVTFEYNAALRVNRTFWWILIAVGWGMVAPGIILLAITPPIYVQGSVVTAGKGSQLTLRVDLLGDEQRSQELRAIIKPDV
jgi:hypothetical protein